VKYLLEAPCLKRLSYLITHAEGKLPPAPLCCQASPHSTGMAESYGMSGHASSLRDRRRHSCVRITSTTGTKGIPDFLYFLLVSFFTSCFLGVSSFLLPSILFSLLFFSCPCSPFSPLLPCSCELMPCLVPPEKVIHNAVMEVFFSIAFTKHHVVRMRMITTLSKVASQLVCYSASCLADLPPESLF